MMNLAFTRRPMSPALQAILDPNRLLPSEDETSRTTAELAVRLGVKAYKARRRKEGLSDKVDARQQWVTSGLLKRGPQASTQGQAKGRPKGSGSTISAQQRARIIELFRADQWPSLLWIAKQAGVSKGQVDRVLEAAGLWKPADGPLAGALEQLERAMRFRPAGHITRAEFAERAGITPGAANLVLSRRKIRAVKVGTLGFYSEAELRAAGVLP